MYKYFQNKRAIQNNQRSDNRFFHKYVCDFLGFFLAVLWRQQKLKLYIMTKQCIIYRYIISLLDHIRL